MKSQTLGDMNTNVQYDKPMPSKEKMKTGDCCGNRRGEKIGSEESSIRTWNRREKFTGSEDLSTRSGNRRPGRGIVDRVRGFVDQGLKSSTRSETSSTGSEDSSTRTMKSSTRSETSSTGSKYLIFFLAPVSCNARDPQ